jgi:hypothetical protein
MAGQFFLESTMKIEKEADGRYAVHHELFGAMMRLGLVLGGGSRWSAETASGDSLGVYKNRREAAQALVDDATDPVWIRMRGIAANLGLPRSYRDDLRIDRRTLREVRAMDLRWLWVLRENGTHLLSPDIEWHQREIAAVFKAFEEEFSKKQHRARLVMVNAATQAVGEVTRSKVDRLMASPPYFHIESNTLKGGKDPLLHFEVRNQRLLAAPEPGVDSAVEALFLPAARYYAAQRHIDLMPIDVLPVHKKAA